MQWARGRRCQQILSGEALLFKFPSTSPNDANPDDLLIYSMDPTSFSILSIYYSEFMLYVYMCMKYMQRPEDNSVESVLFFYLYLSSGDPNSGHWAAWQALCQLSHCHPSPFNAMTLRMRSQCSSYEECLHPAVSTPITSFPFITVDMYSTFDFTVSWHPSGGQMTKLWKLVLF